MCLLNKKLRVQPKCETTESGSIEQMDTNIMYYRMHVEEGIRLYFFIWFPGRIWLRAHRVAMLRTDLT